MNVNEMKTEDNLQLVKGAPHVPTPSTATVVILATLDTKLAPAVELAGLLRHMGASPVLLDLSIRNEVAVPQDLQVLRAFNPGKGSGHPEKLQSMDSAVLAAQKLLSELVGGGASAAIGLGGGQGTSLCLEVLQVVPDIQRVMVTTSPRGVTFNETTTGLVLVHSVTDIAGRNPYLSRCLATSAAAALGAQTGKKDKSAGDPVVFMSMLGVTTAGVEHAQGILTGHASVAVFHANGLGGMSMEHKLAIDPVAAVLDFTTGELTSEVAGGSTSAGPGRLTTAANKGIPQVVIPGGTDTIIRRTGGARDLDFGGRATVRHAGEIVLVRANAHEMSQVGELTAKRLGAGPGSVKVLVPELGFSQHDHPEGTFFDPDADGEYVKALKRHADSRIEVRTVPLHINDPAFAVEAVELLLELTPHLSDTHR